jgi:hypothetical protein
MYSYDDRLRAVQLCIKLGKRAGLTIRQMGSPTKNALKAWHRAHEQRNGLPKAYMREPKCTLAQRKLAVDHDVVTDAASWSRSRRWAIRQGRCSPAVSKRPSRNSLLTLGKYRKRCHRKRSNPRSWRCACAREVLRRWPRSWVDQGRAADVTDSAQSR